SSSGPWPSATPVCRTRCSSGRTPRCSSATPRSASRTSSGRCSERHRGGKALEREGSVAEGMGTWENWSGTVSVAPTRVYAPRTTAEVADLVARAAERGRRLRPVGSGHSFTPIAAPVEGQVSLRHLTGIVSADREAGAVRVAAGTSLHELNDALARI